MSIPRAGRPRASSLEMLAESACELFLERGFDATSISDIALRAGVSRSSFFNYASSKSGLLWVGFDSRMRRLDEVLVSADTRTALMELFADLAPDTLALAFSNVEAMGLETELEQASAIRMTRMATIISSAEQRNGSASIRADIAGAAYAGAVMTALRHWSLAGSGKQALRSTLELALGEIDSVLSV